MITLGLISFIVNGLLLLIVDWISDLMGFGLCLLYTSDAADDGVLPAHELRRYRETAVLVDASGEDRLAAFGELVNEITRGSDGQGSDWVATRVVSPSTDAPRARRAS